MSSKSNCTDYNKITKDFLIEEYINKKKSFRSIAEEYGFSKSTIYLRLKQHNILRRRNNEHFNDVTGQKFGLLKVVERKGTNGKRIIWKCQCDCGNCIEIASDKLISGNTSSCGCIKKSIGPKNKSWRGFGEISLELFGSIRRGAETRNIQFNITIEDIWELFLKQRRKCSLTGIELCFPIGQKRLRDYDHTASLDRIDSKKGYFIDNVQWVYKDVNIMKNTYEQENFIYLCNMVARQHPRDIIGE